MLKKISGKRLLAVITTVCILVTLLAVAGPAIIMANNTTYYVDSVSGNDNNNGTSTGTAWRTLSKVNSVTFQPGDNILFKAGCSWSGCLKPQGSGLSGSPITIDMYGTGSKPLITGGLSGEFTSKGNIYAGAYFRNQEYWEINNLQITNNNGQGTKDYERTGIWFYNSGGGIKHGIKIMNCDIHDVNSQIFDNFSRVFAAIQFNVLGSGTGFNGVTINSNYIHNCYDTAGIYVAVANLSTRDDNTGMSTATQYNSNYTVSNNTVDHVGLDGIQVGCLNNGLIDGNICKYASTYNETELQNRYNQGQSSINNAWTLGIWSYGGDYVTVQNNEAAYATSGGDAEGYDIEKNSRYSIYQYNYSHNNMACLLDAASNDQTISNIFRYNISQNEIDRVLETNNSHFIDTSNYNNVYYVSNGYNPYIFEVFAALWDQNNYTFNYKEFKNNIIVNNSNGSFTNPRVTVTGLDYNCYWGNTSGWYGGSHTIWADPKFVNPGSGGDGRNTLDGYKLQSSSPCINAGVTMSGGGGRDYWGYTVPYAGGNTDIGAHEYQGSTGYTMVNDDAAGMSYSGTWYDDNNRPSEYNGDLHYTGTNGNYVQYTFTGTGVDWINEKANDMGNVKVHIDGNLDATVSIYSSTRLHQQTVYSKTGLTSGSHTIKLEKQDGSWMSFDVLKIYSGGGTTPTPTPTPAISTINDSVTGTGTNQFEYVGSWTHATGRPNSYSSDEHYSNTTNDYIQFRFNGTRIKIYSSKSTDMGKADFSIDGGAASTCDFYNGSQIWKQLIYDSGTLSTGSHTLKVQLKGQKNPGSSGYYVCADYVEVTN